VSKLAFFSIPKFKVKKFMTDIFFLIGDFFTWAFNFLKMFGNLPNFLFILVALGFLGFWIYQTSLFEKLQK
jgi:hypothetical protein